MTLEKYFHIIHNLLQHHWAVLEKQIDYATLSKERGEIDGRIDLLDGSYIDIYEEIFIINKSLIKGRYSYQYMRESPVFRYDNYNKHPGISSPYQHKHTSKGVV